jgi:hypothetical protein
VFATAIQIHCSLIFAGKPRAYQTLKDKIQIVKLLALPTNIRQVWKLMTEALTQAYYNTAKNVAVKSFIVQAPAGDSTKLLAAVTNFIQ